jgi:hypothetical protein
VDETGAGSQPNPKAGWPDVQLTLTVRTIRPGIPPSELVVANALRQTLPEFLLNNHQRDFIEKFIVERQDPATMEMFRLAT